MAVDKRGSSDVLAEIDLGKRGRIVFKDDGHSDFDTYFRWYDDSGSKIVGGRSTQLNSMRDQLNDGQKFMDAFDGLSRSDSSGSGQRRSDSGGSSLRDHGAFKCDECNKTWPGKDNTNPGSGPDKCPECGDDEDD